jgi:hypothetical protein
LKDYYGSKEWSETVIEIAEKELVNENRVVFARIQEIRLWIRKLRRFGYPKKASELNDKLSSMLSSGGLPFTPSLVTESTEVLYQQGLCSLYTERGFTECPFPVRLTIFSSCHVCLPDLEKTRDQMYGKLKASTKYRPLSFCYNCSKTFDDKVILDLNRPFKDFSVELGRDILNFMYCPICGYPYQLYRQS